MTNKEGNPLFFLCLSTVIVSIFLYCGFFALPSADDFFYANLIKDHGLVDAQIQHYIDWSGRYSATFLLTFFSQLGFSQYWLVPWICILSLIFSTYLFIKTWHLGKLKNRDLLVFSFCLITVFLSLSTAGPGHGIKVINEGFYWYSGAVTYIISLSLYLLLLVVFVKRSRGEMERSFHVVAAVLLFLLLGMNETVMFLICLTIVPTLLFNHKKYGYTVTTLLILVIVAGASLMIFAPGNSVRMSTSDGGNILSAVGVCFEKLAQILAFNLLNPFLWLFTVTFTSTIDSLKHQLNSAHLSNTMIYGFGALLIYLLYFPVAYSLNSGAPDRLVAFIGFFALCASVLYINTLLKIVRKRLHSMRMVQLILVILSVLSSGFLLQPLLIGGKTLYMANSYKTKHAERINYITSQREKGMKSAQVDGIPRNELLLFEDLKPDDPNRSFAQFYGMDAVTLKK